MAEQPLDRKGRVLPVLRFKANTSQALSANIAASTRSNQFGGTTQVISVLSVTYPVYFDTGNSSIGATTSSHYLPPDNMLQLKLGDHTHLAVRAVSSNTTIYVSELE